ncbi:MULTISPECIES: hypothetical protein [unclassified Haladaptatus]|uniref:hypothetical protein n=1 Tax=unclassified Haladaptatus TaxID=2622732 RepID=UPI00209C622E|nr:MULTISPECIES: hypothetical protein [unclassified Haladaptatus]MCO8244563.1 hypothetical protein [Haladaptatus sp. AB643]MCO8253815.1 hypothetical protein [Haladaptatus sp. AB618]
MRKSLKILLVMSMVASVFAIGFAGNAAADSQSSHQWASSHVDQEQYVAQGNSNYQDDNVAVSAALGHDAESGNAYAVQANYQSNKNSQSAYSNAQNFNHQSQEDGHSPWR